MKLILLSTLLFLCYGMEINLNTVTYSDEKIRELNTPLPETKENLDDINNQKCIACQQLYPKLNLAIAHHTEEIKDCSTFCRKCFKKNGCEVYVDNKCLRSSKCPIHKSAEAEHDLTVIAADKFAVPVTKEKDLLELFFLTAVIAISPHLHHMDPDTTLTHFLKMTGTLSKCNLIYMLPFLLLWGNQKLLSLRTGKRGYVYLFITFLIILLTLTGAVEAGSIIALVFSSFYHTDLWTGGKLGVVPKSFQVYMNMLPQFLFTGVKSNTQSFGAGIDRAIANIFFSYLMTVTVRSNFFDLPQHDFQGLAGIPATNSHNIAMVGFFFMIINLLWEMGKDLWNRNSLFNFNNINQWTVGILAALFSDPQQYVSLVVVFSIITFVTTGFKFLSCCCGCCVCCGKCLVRFLGDD